MKYLIFLISFSAMANPTKYAISAALNHVGWDIGSKNRTIEIVTPSAESFEEATVTVIDKGYLDDSIMGRRWIIQVKKNSSGRWEKKSVKTINICARGPETSGPCP